MKILIFCLLIYLQTFVDGGNNDEFATFFSPKSVFEQKSHKAFIVTKNLKHETEIGVQFRRVNVTVHAQNDGILRINFKKKKTSGMKAKTEIIYTALRNVSSKANPQCSTQKNFVTFVKDKFYTFIQLDKPVYAPGDTVKFRIIVVDRDLKPYHMSNIDINIIDPFNRTMFEFNDLDKMYAGIFSNSFTLGDHTPLGDWTIRVIVDKLKNRKVAKIIPVQKYVLPLFTVNLNLADKHLLENQKLELTISAEYPYGDYVAGDAELTIQSVENNTVHLKTTFKNIKDTHSVSYHLKDNLGIKTDNHASFTATVKFTEPESGSSENKTVQFTVHKDMKHNINVIHPPKFICDLPFNVRVYPSNWKNESINDHFEKAFVSYKYKFTNGEGMIEHKRFPVVNGVAIFHSIIPNNTQSLSIEANFIDSDVYRAEILQGSTYIKARDLVVDYLPKLPSIKDKITMHVGSITDLDEIVVVTMTRHGNTQSKKENCGFKLSCNITMEITDDMVPESTVLIYAVSDVHQFAYGEVVIKSKNLGVNHLNVKLSTVKQKRKSAISTKTNSNIVMEFDTTINSKVYLMAFDKRLTYLRQGNEVSRHDVINEVSKFDSKLNVDFDDFKAWHDCTSNELLRVSSGRKTMAQHSTDFTSGGNDDDDDPDDSNDEPISTEDDPEEKSEDNLLRHSFPESWIFEEFDVKNKMEKKIFKVPNSITSWVVSAFAMHKKAGIAVADPTEITVKNEFFIKMMLPFSIRFNEELGLNILVYNYAEHKKPITVTVSLHNDDKDFQFVDFNKSIDYSIYNGSSYQQRCTPSYSDRNITTISNIIVPSSGVKKVKFYIRSHPIFNQFKGLYKNISLIVKAQGYFDGITYVDKVKRKLRVEQFGVKQYDLNQQSLKLVKNKAQTWLPIVAEPDNTTGEFSKISSFITADYLSDVTHLNSRLSLYYYDSIEQRTTKIKANVEYLRYMKAKKLTAVSVDINSNYQNMLSYRNARYYYDHYDVYHSVQVSYSVQVGYTAYFIDTVASGMKIGAITQNKNQIYTDFDRIASNQLSDGSFNNFGPYPTINSGDSATRKYFETAYVLVSLIKHRDYSISDYTYYRTKAFTYLDSPSKKLNIQPEAMSVAAYAYALNNEISKAEEFMKEVEKYAIKSGPKENCFKLSTQSTSCDMRHTAYSILAYVAMNQAAKARPLVLALLKTFSLNSNFQSTHGYAIAAEAISTLLSDTKVAETDFTVTLKNDYDFEHTVSFNALNASYTGEVSFPEYSKHAYISSTGSGYCTVLTVIESMIRLPTVKSYFSVKITPKISLNKIRQIEFCANHIANAEHGTNINDARFEIEMPSGYIFKEVLDIKSKANFIEDVVTRRIETLVIIKMRDIKTHQNYCFEINAEKVFDVAKPQAAGVKVYNFLNKDSATIQFYQLTDKECY